MLKFSPANVKIQALSLVPAIASFLTAKRKVYSFDLLSGFSCPFANECFSKAVVGADGKKSIQDGKNTLFRCFSASQEVLFTNVYNLRKANFDALRGKTAGEMIKLLAESLPKNAGVIRIHVAGDFFNQEYFDAWLSVALCKPDTLFYAYTKSLPYWVARMDQIPANFVLTASRGGRRDALIEKHTLRSVKVVFSEAEASAAGLEIDHTDEHAANPETRLNDFALLIHGTQPKGSTAADAIKVLKKNGVQFAYSRNKKEGAKSVT
jgi:hypothetical protein